MKKKIRVISKLEIKNSFLIKGLQYEGLRKIGNPIDYGLKYFKDFLKYINTSEEEFYDTLDKFRPDYLWEKVGNNPQYCQNWKLKYKIS